MPTTGLNTGSGHADHGLGTGAQIDTPDASPPDCSNAAPVGLVLGALGLALVAAGILFYIGALPCGAGLYIALAGVAVGAALMVAAIVTWRAYLDCLGRPDPCPNAATIENMMKAAAGIFATLVAAIIGGATGSSGLCSIPIVGWLASVISAATTAYAAAFALIGLGVMLGLLVGLMIQYDSCRKSQR